MKDITVIIPMHEFSDGAKELLKRAVESVPEDIQIILACPKATTKDDLAGISERVKVEKVSEETSFQSLVNGAVAKCKTKWFSILEFDDIYTGCWLDNIVVNIEYHPDTSVFMFLDDVKDFKTDEYVGYGNEAAWASAFSNEIGHIDLDCLQNFFDFYLTGSVFNRDDWNEVGGLKTNLPIVFWYEFLLRLTNKGKDVYVIPKVGYVHYLGRDGSLVESYKGVYSDQKEVDYWFNTAKKEYFYVKQRDVKPYQPKNEEDEEE